MLPAQIAQAAALPPGGALTSWSLEPLPTIGIVIAGALYVQGLRSLPLRGGPPQHGTSCPRAPVLPDGRATLLASGGGPGSGARGALASGTDPVPVPGYARDVAPRPGHLGLDPRAVPELRCRGRLPRCLRLERPAPRRHPHVDLGDVPDGAGDRSG